MLKFYELNNECGQIQWVEKKSHCVRGDILNDSPQLMICATCTMSQSKFWKTNFDWNEWRGTQSDRTQQLVITTLSKMIICSLKGYSNPHWYCSRVRMAGTPKIWLHYWAGRNFIFCMELYQVCGVFLVNKFCQLNMWIIRWRRIAQKYTQVYMFNYWKIDF